jgi:polar amino acid transport system substrate-binding protein
LKKSHVVWITLLALMLVLALGIAACGEDTNTEVTESTAGGSTETTAATGEYDLSTIVASIEADPALTAMLPEKNQKDGVVVAADIPYMPWEGFVEGTDQPTGFDYDLSQALAAKLGVPFEFTQVVFDSIIIGIQAKKYDLSMSCMYDNPERQEVLDFVDYADDTTAVITVKGNPKGITNLDSLSGLVVGCEKGTTQAAMLEELNTELDTAGKAKMDVKQFPSQADSLLALQAGTIDCDVTDRSTAFYNAETTMKDNEKVFELVVDPDAPDGYDPAIIGMGVLKENTQLRDALQKALQALIDDGTLKTIAAHWGPVAVTSAEINQGK